MTYAKPEVNILGDATCVIQLTGHKGSSGIFDPSLPSMPIDPAYDLDQ